MTLWIIITRLLNPWTGQPLCMNSKKPGQDGLLYYCHYFSFRIYAQNELSALEISDRWWGQVQERSENNSSCITFKGLVPWDRDRFYHEQYARITAVFRNVALPETACTLQTSTIDFLAPKIKRKKQRGAAMYRLMSTSEWKTKVLSISQHYERG